MAKHWIDVPGKEHSVPVTVRVGDTSHPSHSFQAAVKIPPYQIEVDIGGDPPPPPPPPSGGLPIGTYRSNANPADADSFFSWLGSGQGTGVRIMLQDVILRDTIAQMRLDDPWCRTTVQRAVEWQRRDPANRTINLSYPPCSFQTAFQLDRSARGEFDGHYEAAANHLLNLGMTAAYIRIGHEPDGDWFPYGDRGDINFSKHFATTFRRVVDAFRRVADRRGIKVDWRYVYNPTHNRFLRRDLIEAQYPGNDHCHVISTDTYDQFKERPYAEFEARWGLTKQRWDAFLEFCDRKGRPGAIDEWGVWNADERWNGGIDNPVFVERLSDAIEANLDRLAYHCPFDCLQKHRLQPATISPRASAAFLKRWHASARRLASGGVRTARMEEEAVRPLGYDPGMIYVYDEHGEQVLVEPREVAVA